MMIYEILNAEGYSVTKVRQASEIVDILDVSPTPYLLIADNMVFNPEAHRLREILDERPELRQRLKIISGNVVFARKYYQEQIGTMIDDFLNLPFTVEQLLACVETNAAGLSD